MCLFIIVGQYPSTDEWVKKMWCVCVCIHIYIYIYMYAYTHTHTMEYYSAIKKNEIMPFGTTWISLEDIVLSEVSQTERDQHHKPQPISKTITITKP